MLRNLPVMGCAFLVLTAAVDRTWGAQIPSTRPTSQPVSTPRAVFERQLEGRWSLIAASDPFMDVVARDSGTGLTGGLALWLVSEQAGAKVWLHTETAHGEDLRIIDAWATERHWVAVFGHGEATVLRARLVSPEGRTLATQPGSPAAGFKLVRWPEPASVRLRAEAATASIRQIGQAPVFLVQLRQRDGKSVEYLCVFDETDATKRPCWWERARQSGGPPPRHQP